MRRPLDGTSWETVQGRRLFERTFLDENNGAPTCIPIRSHYDDDDDRGDVTPRVPGLFIDDSLSGRSTSFSHPFPPPFSYYPLLIPGNLVSISLYLYLIAIV